MGYQLVSFLARVVVDQIQNSSPAKAGVITWRGGNAADAAHKVTADEQGE